MMGAFHLQYVHCLIYSISVVESPQSVTITVWDHTEEERLGYLG